jgi:hypothetical protein
MGFIFIFARVLYYILVVYTCFWLQDRKIGCLIFFVFLRSLVLLHVSRCFTNKAQQMGDNATIFGLELM